MILLLKILGYVILGYIILFFLVLGVTNIMEHIHYWKEMAKENEKVMWSTKKDKPQKKKVWNDKLGVYEIE